MIPAHEGRQSPGAEPLWADSWYVDFSGPDGRGGFVRLSLYPNLGVAWWWTYLVTPDGPLVAVRDHEVPLPRGYGGVPRNPPGLGGAPRHRAGGLEIRADGLWAELVCETAFEHWSIGLEAFGVAFEDPAEAWRSEWGDRLAVGLDLEWEALARPVAAGGPGPAGHGYVQAGRVIGTVLLGEERIDVDRPGLRARAWGVSDWWAAVEAGGAAGTGVVGHWAASLGPDGRCLVFDHSAELVELSAGAGGVPERAVYRLGGEEWEAVVLGSAPVLVTGPERAPVRLARALCRFAGPGQESTGWAEWRLKP